MHRSNPHNRSAVLLLVLGAFSVAIAGLVSRKARKGSAHRDRLHIRQSLAINRSISECYSFWRAFENFPKFMRHLESVENRGGDLSHWRATGPAGTSVEWDARIVAERPNELIAWRSLENADIENAGSVRFDATTRGTGTLLRVDIVYRPPARRLGASIAKLFGEEPEQQLDEDLRRFKQIMEVGEVITTEGQPSGRARSTSPKYDRTVHAEPLENQGPAHPQGA